MMIPTTIKRLYRITRTARCRPFFAVAMLAAGVPATARAQSVFSTSLVFQYADSKTPGASTTANGCFASNVSTGALATNASCSVPANPGGGGTLSAVAKSAFDPLTGSFKTMSSISASNYTLSQFVPKYDPATGDRLYTGDARPDVVGASSLIGLSDSFFLNAAPGVNPATISFFLNIDGTLQAPAQPGGGTTYASSFVNVCAGEAGACSGGDPSSAFTGIAGMSLDSDGSSQFGQSSTAPPGANPPTLTFAGDHSPGSVNGQLTIADVPVSADTPFDFAFIFFSQAFIFHPTATIGHIPVGCDPFFDGACTQLPVDPVDISGETVADFYHTVMFAGYKVLDANGNDVTNQVQLQFGSGLNVPPGAPTVATPEPGTFVLVAGGLIGVATGVRRRRNARRSKSLVSA